MSKHTSDRVLRPLFVATTKKSSSDCKSILYALEKKLKLYKTFLGYTKTVIPAINTA